MTLRYKKLHKRQKDLQNRIDTKISNDIYNVQQVLEAIASQNQSQGTDFIQYNDTIQGTNRKEKQKQPKNNVTNTIVRENKKIINYKTRPDWYASLLMYNSY